MRIIAFITGLVLATSAGASDLKEPRSIFTPLAAAVSNQFAGFYGGVVAGSQFTDITISEDGHDFSGISADGLLAGAHVGYNLCGGRFCLGPRVEYAFSDVAVEFGPLGDVLRMDDYFQISAQAGVTISNDTLLSVRVGYEWQNWVLDLDRVNLGEHDATVEAVVIGASLETMVTSQLSVAVDIDYLMFNETDAPGLDRALEDSDALRVKVRGSWYPGLLQ